MNTLDGESFTYGHMATLIEKFHLLFEKAGFKKGDHIALWAKNSARWGMSYLAINTYETVVVPLLADFTPDGVERLIDHSDSVALFVNGDKWKQLRRENLPKIRLVIKKWRRDIQTASIRKTWSTRRTIWMTLLSSVTLQAQREIRKASCSRTGTFLRP